MHLLFLNICDKAGLIFKISIKLIDIINLIMYNNIV